MTYAQIRPYHSPAPILFAILALLAGMTVLLFKDGIHADMTHPEGAQTRNCFNQHKQFETWQERGNSAVHLLCTYPGDKTVYDLIVEKVSGNWREKTGFSPKQHDYSSVRSWLTDNTRRAKKISPPADLPEYFSEP